jgi:ABC-type molybdate transport system substrate-binding protein
MPNLSNRLRIVYTLAMVLIGGILIYAVVLTPVQEQLTPTPTPMPSPTPIASIDVEIVTALAVEPWVSQAAQTYNDANYTIDGRPVNVEIIPMQGLTALNKWGRGDFDTIPTAWLAESRIWVDQANVNALDRTGQDIFLAGGRYRAQPVALSPLVWGIWQGAYDALTEHFDTDAISWDELHSAAQADTWENLSGDPDWGRFKLVVAHPIRDPAGLTAMVGAAGEYYDNPALTADELQSNDFLTWLGDLFDTVVDFSPVGAENMLLYGRSNGDAGQLVEAYLLTEMASVESRWGETIQIVYPDPISWFDFPFAIYMGNETSAEEKQAALEFKDYLLSAEQQAIALEYGLRPACPECPTDGGLIAQWSNVGVLENIPSTSRMRPATIRGLESLTEWYVTRYEE